MKIDVTADTMGDYTQVTTIINRGGKIYADATTIFQTTKNLNGWALDLETVEWVKRHITKIQRNMKIDRMFGLGAI